MNEELEGMEPDNTRVDGKHKMGSFNDLMGDMTIIKIKKLKAPDDIDDMEDMDDDIQDDTNVDIESMIREING